MFFGRLLLSLLLALLLFAVMVTAFHLLNLPSDRAVVGGVCLLVLMMVGGGVVFRRIWRMRWLCLVK